MNKLLGQLMTMLYAPVEKEGAAGGSDESADTGADEGSMYGKQGVKIPSKNDTEKPAKGAKTEDFSDEGEEKTEKEDGDDETDFSDKDESETEESDTEETETEEVDEKPATTLRIDPRDLAAITQQKQSQGDDKLTPEQLRSMLNPVEVTEDTLKALGFAEPTREQVKGFQEFSNAVVKNAVSVARLLIQKETKRFEAAMGPLSQHYQQQQMLQTKQAFFSEYKDLARYEEVMKIAANEIEETRSDGSQKSQKQIFKEVATLTRKKLQALGVKIEQQSNANHSAGAKGGVPRAANSSAPGRSGGDQHSGKGKPNNADADIYAR
jgi:hypothetical protein